MHASKQANEKWVVQIHFLDKQKAQYVVMIGV
jgi:hypothetical protein